MKFLLDTHVLLWASMRPERLTDRVRALMTGSEPMFWSAASTWEIGIKVKTGRLELPVSLADFAARVLLTVQSLDVRHAHAVMAADLPLHHRDPFDRMLVAQALVEGMTLVSSDPLLSLYEAPVLWS